ncbi:MAG: hypothetical protein P4L81_08130, partial [Candidatus Pacebacteria bacterium]|nr:hypothetical protein [Candidatus Paceibacterota bacterium]
MELNALTRWESIGKDLYKSGAVGRDIQRLKARSKLVDAHRTERSQTRNEVEETIEAEGGTPSQSRVELTDLEREEAAILAKWRSLREKGKKLRVEEDQLEAEVVSDLPASKDIFPPGHAPWVYFAYRSIRRFFKGFAF